MRSIKVDFGSQTLAVRLHDNPAVNRWADFVAGKISQRARYQTFCRTFFDQPLGVVDTIREWQQILDTLQEFRDHGMQIPFLIPTAWDRQQQTLNVLHRFFTDSLSWHADLAHDPKLPNPYDADFVLPDTLVAYNDWRTLVAKINTAVHKLETLSQMTDNREFVIKNYPLRSWAFVIDLDITFDTETWLDFDLVEQDNNFSYFDDDRPQAILDWSIQGKSILQSFAEHDDPRAKDCTGRLGSSGGFFVDIDSNRKLLYNSERFKAWIHAHGLKFEQLPLEFPIGWIEDIDAWRSLWRPGPCQVSSICIE